MRGKVSHRSAVSASKRTKIPSSSCELSESVKNICSNASITYRETVCSFSNKAVTILDEFSEALTK